MVFPWFSYVYPIKITYGISQGKHQNFEAKKGRERSHQVGGDLAILLWPRLIKSRRKFHELVNTMIFLFVKIILGRSIDKY